MDQIPEGAQSVKIRLMIQKTKPRKSSKHRTTDRWLDKLRNIDN